MSLFSPSPCRARNWVKGLFAGLLLIFCGSSVFAQATIDPAWIVVQNRYLILGVEPTNGQFHLFTTSLSGLVSLAGIDSGKTTLRIDPAADDPNSNRAIFGETGTFVTRPTKESNESIFAVFDTQEGLTGAETGTGSGFAVRIEQRLTLVRDTLRIQYTVRNNGKMTHKIGTRVVLDQDLGYTLGQGASFIVPGQAPMEFQTEFTSALMPATYQAVDSLIDPTIVTRGIVSGDGATPPNRLLFADGALLAANYDIASNPLSQLPVTGNSVYYYQDAPYTKGASKTFTLYFGLANSTSDYEPNPVVALESPNSVQLLEGDDPTTGEKEAFYYDSQNLVIAGFVYNTSSVAIANTSAFLILPAGLEFREGDIASKSTGNIAAFSEKSMTWKVKATGRVTGPLPVTLTTSSSGATSKSVTRTIDVPPLPQAFTTQSLRMVAFPFTYDNPDPKAVLVDASTTPTATLDPIRLATYDSDLGDYLYYTRGQLPALEAGRGYWMQTKPNQATTLTFQGSHLIPTTEDFLVELKRDWNMVGSPYTTSVYLGRTKFVFSGQSYSWSEAVQRGLIRSSLWSWDPNIEDYVAISKETSQIAPMTGYWIKTLVRGVRLAFPADMNLFRSSRGRSAPRSQPAVPSGAATRDTAGNTEWLLQISARFTQGRKKDTSNYLGVSSYASDNYDLQDVDEPPPFSGYVNVRFPHSDWGKDSGNYSRDIRRSFVGRKSWDMEVATDQPSTDLALNWGNIHQIPRRYRLTLVDVESGQRVYMRTAESYVFRSGPQGGAHRFRIEVDTDPSSALRITGVLVSPGAVRGLGQAISFNLSRGATVRCEIRSVTGRSVRILDPGTLKSSGLNLLNWDLRGGSGQILPRGLYLMELTAIDPEQQTVKVVKTLRIN